MQQDLHPSLSQQNIAATALVIVELTSARKTPQPVKIFTPYLRKTRKVAIEPFIQEKISSGVRNTQKELFIRV